MTADADTVGAADGTPLHIEESGPADADVTVVMAHGWTLDSRTWEPVARRLDAHARVLRYDHRGHGRSAPVDPSTMTIDQLADDMAAVVADRAPTGPLVLAGHSMGGMTIMALAERHPSLVADRVAGWPWWPRPAAASPNAPSGWDRRRWPG
ncbi:alpha/beta fold hydrolase [Pseudonocardia benzenivorans]